LGSAGESEGGAGGEPGTIALPTGVVINELKGQGTGADFIEQLRGQSTGAPVGTLDNLLERLGADEFNLIAVGCALLSDPAWPKKIRSGRLDTLLPFDKAQFASLV
jgi:2,4-dienoyl-CoA reductase-like NADH-dependent reductase (Old Yellow Enzyme family)